MHLRLQPDPDQEAVLRKWLGVYTHYYDLIVRVINTDHDLMGPFRQVRGSGGNMDLQRAMLLRSILLNKIQTVDAIPATIWNAMALLSKFFF